MDTVLERQKRLDKIERLESEIAELESELSEIEEEAEDDACPSCGGEISNDERLCCFNCLFAANRLLAIRSPEQIACKNAEALKAINAMKIELDYRYKKAFWHYSNGEEAIADALFNFSGTRHKPLK